MLNSHSLNVCMYVCMYVVVYLGSGGHWVMVPPLDLKNLFLTLFFCYNWVMPPPPPPSDPRNDFNLDFILINSVN